MPNSIFLDAPPLLLEIISDLKNAVTSTSTQKGFKLLQSLEDEDSHFDEEGQLTLYCLHALTNVNNLSPDQQEIIWNLHTTSPRALVKALTLLVLSRQQPLSEKVFKLMLHFTKPNPKILFSKTMQTCQSISVSAFGRLLYDLSDEGSEKLMREQIIKSLLNLATSKLAGAQIGLASEGKNLLGADTNALSEMIGLPKTDEPFSNNTNMMALSTDQAYKTLFEYYLKDIADVAVIDFDS